LLPEKKLFFFQGNFFSNLPREKIILCSRTKMSDPVLIKSTYKYVVLAN
jgi:hypothetical protein